MPRIDEERRRVWLRSLRRFKDGMKVRAKMGILHAYCQQVAAERRGKHGWSAPHWDHEKWVTYLYTCIRDGEFPPRLLIAFIETAEVTFLNPRFQPTVEGTLEAVDIVCRQQSKQLRQKFGVFL